MGEEEIQDGTRWHSTTMTSVRWNGELYNNNGFSGSSRSLSTCNGEIPVDGAKWAMNCSGYSFSCLFFCEFYFPIMSCVALHETFDSLRWKTCEGGNGWGGGGASCTTKKTNFLREFRSQNCDANHDSLTSLPRIILCS